MPKWIHWSRTEMVALLFHRLMLLAEEEEVLLRFLELFPVPHTPL